MPMKRTTRDSVIFLLATATFFSSVTVIANAGVRTWPESLSGNEIAHYESLERSARQQEILDRKGGDNTPFITGLLPTIIVLGGIIPLIVLTFASTG